MRVGRLTDMIRNRNRREELYTTAAYWDAKAVEYEGSAVSMWPNSHLNRYYQSEQISMMDKVLPDVAGYEILDVACGTGRTARYFAGRGAKVLGIDFSVKAIEIALRLSAGDNPAFKLQSIFDLDLSNRFDLAVTWSAIVIACKNRQEVSRVLANIRRALKPGGRILLCEPLHKGFLHRSLDMGPSEFCDVLSESGFRILDISQLHFWPMRLALAFIPWPKTATAVGYHTGQWIMSLVNNKAFGDYKVIYARSES